jgi:hypothetical protein
MLKKIFVFITFFILTCFQVSFAIGSTERLNIAFTNNVNGEVLPKTI